MLDINKICDQLAGAINMVNFALVPTDNSAQPPMLTSAHYRKGQQDVYIHRYQNSFIFFIRDNQTKEEASCQFWVNKFEIQRNFESSTLTEVFDRVVQLCTDYLDKKITLL